MASYDLMRELINARDALNELVHLTPDGMPEDAGIANGALLKMVADRMNKASREYMCAAESAIHTELEGQNGAESAI